MTMLVENNHITATCYVKKRHVIGKSGGSYYEKIMKIIPLINIENFVIYYLNNSIYNLNLAMLGYPRPLTNIHFLANYFLNRGTRVIGMVIGILKNYTQIPNTKIKMLCKI